MYFMNASEPVLSKRMMTDYIITDSHTIVNKITAKFYYRQKLAVLLYICHLVFIAIAGAAGTKSTVYADIGWVPADIGRTLGRDTGACACLETSGGFTKR